MKVSRGGLNDNPWAMTDTTRECLHMSVEQEEDVPAQRHRLVPRLVQGTLAMDLLLGSTFAICTSILLDIQDDQAPSLILVTVLLLAATYLTRAIAGILATATDFCPTQGLSCSASLSLPMGIFYLLLAIIVGFARHPVRTYLRTHLVKSKFTTLLLRHYHWIWMTLLIGSLLEFVRWNLVHSYARSILSSRQPPNEQVIIVPRNRRPWWWRRDSRLREPLLPRDHDIRDDTSVDFASVQEEWASKAEEDPLWWTKDEDEMISPNLPDTSWAKDDRV